MPLAHQIAGQETSISPSCPQAARLTQQSLHQTAADAGARKFLEVGQVQLEVIAATVRVVCSMQLLLLLRSAAGHSGRFWCIRRSLISSGGRSVNPVA